MQEVSFTQPCKTGYMLHQHHLSQEPVTDRHHLLTRLPAREVASCPHLSSWVTRCMATPTPYSGTPTRLAAHPSADRYREKNHRKSKHPTFTTNYTSACFQAGLHVLSTYKTKTCFPKSWPLGWSN